MPALPARPHAGLRRHPDLIADVAMAVHGVYASAMSTLTEITTAADGLTTEEIVQLERSLHELLRRRGVGLVYADSYGSLSDQQLLADADAAFLAYDQAEAGSR